MANQKTIWLLCAVLLIAGCGSSQSVKINEAARKEAQTAENGRGDGIQKGWRKYLAGKSLRRGNGDDDGRLENEQSEICRRRRRLRYARESSCAGFDQNAGSDERTKASFDNKEAEISRTK
jgi:hypothetical protein